MKIARPPKNVLVSHEEMVSLMKDFIKVSPHPLPDYCVGFLWTLDGMAEVAYELMSRIDRQIEKYYVKKTEVSDANKEEG